MVRIQAQTIRPATPHLTAEMRRVAPTPMIAPVMVCVVDTGMPRRVARKSVIAPEVAAGDEQAGDDAHRLLGVVAAMAQAVEAGRDELQAPEELVELERVPVPE